METLHVGLKPKELKLVWQRGQESVLEFALETAAGVAIDNTGFTYSFKIALAFNKTATVSLSAVRVAPNKVKITMTKTESNDSTKTPAAAVYQLVETDTLLKDRCLLFGELEMKDRI